MIPAIAAFFYLSTALVPGARACSLCDGPPLPPPEIVADPAAPLHLGAPGAATPSEQAYIRSLQEGRRYRVRETWIEDLQAPPEKHLLSAQAVMDLLRDPSRSAASSLETRYGPDLKAGKPVRPNEEEKVLAAHLYWNRGGLLEPRSREFLRLLLPTAATAVAPDAGETAVGDTTLVGVMGGVMGDTTKVVSPVASPTLAMNVPAAPDELLDRLKASLELDDHGKPAERKALDETFARMLQSPTARRLAEELIGEGRKVKVSFEAMPDTKIVPVNGIKYLYGTGGSTSATEKDISVKINAGYMDADPYVMNSNAPVTLAHELLGHALGDIRAVKGGVLNSYYLYHNNETNAGVVGWTVQLEINGTATNAGMWQYLADEDAYHRSMQLTRAYYASTLNPEEMKDPVPVLQDRIVRAKAEKVKIQADIEDYKLYQRIMAHLVSGHGWKAGDYAALHQDLKNNLDAYLPEKIKHLDAIIAHLESYVKWFGTPSGKHRIKELQKTPSQEFLKAQEAALKARKDHLAKSLKAKGVSAPATGPSWLDRQREMLAEEYRKDREKNPGHWK